jgi:hypothetical protein
MLGGTKLICATTVRVGMKDRQFELWIGDAAEIRIILAKRAYRRCKARYRWATSL